VPGAHDPARRQRFAADHAPLASGRGPCRGQSTSADRVPESCQSGGDYEMADHGEVEYATANGNDYAEHEQTYTMFLKLVKWGLAIVTVILILMAYFLV
jgi:hypothetical protein